jgi:hypothetical protein
MLRLKLRSYLLPLLLALTGLGQLFYPPTAHAKLAAKCNTLLTESQINTELGQILFKYLSDAYSDTCYKKYLCSNNAKGMVKALHSELGNDFLKAYNTEVLYLHDANWNYLRPKKSRSFAIWTFHVVLRVGPYILDPDFEKEPTLIEAKDYFARMFGSDNVLIRKISYKNYLAFGARLSPIWEDTIEPQGWIETILDDKPELWQKQKNGQHQFLSTLNDSYRFLFTKASYRKYPPMTPDEYLQDASTARKMDRLHF